MSHKTSAAPQRKPLTKTRLLSRSRSMASSIFLLTLLFSSTAIETSERPKVIRPVPTGGAVPPCSPNSAKVSGFLTKQNEFPQLPASDPKPGSPERDVLLFDRP